MIVESLRALIAKWREMAKKADRLAGEHDAKGDGANSHAFRKERRTLTECADELLDVLALLDAEPQAEGWQPIETAPKDDDVFFWVEPRTEDEAFLNTSGRPIVSSFPPHLFRGRYRTWSASSKATHWRPLPAPPLKGCEAHAPASAGDERAAFCVSCGDTVTAPDGSCAACGAGAIDIVFPQQSADSLKGGEAHAGTTTTEPSVDQRDSVTGGGRIRTNTPTSTGGVAASGHEPARLTGTAADRPEQRQAESGESPEPPSPPLPLSAERLVLLTNELNAALKERAVEHLARQEALLSEIDRLTAALAPQHNHETCVANLTAQFDVALDQSMDAKDAAEAEVARLTAALALSEALKDELYDSLSNTMEERNQFRECTAAAEAARQTLQQALQALVTVMGLALQPATAEAERA